MKHFFAALLVAFLGLTAATAQTLPPSPPAGLQGVALRDWLRQNWYDGKRVDLGYDRARGKMYNYVDVFNGQLVCVYSGYSVPKTIDSVSTSTANVGRINCEHSIPQSWFNEVSRMRSDIHHLYPTYDTWNSNRGSDPFGEIADSQTQIWMRGTVSQSTIPTTNLPEWSEDTPSMFEPREDHKGNLARSAFYFYTMHAGQSFDPGKDVITALADLNTLYQWHLADPVDAHERERNRRVAKAQGNFNPYIADPSLVARAWGFAPAGPTVAFAANSGTIAEGNTGTTNYTFTLSVSPTPTAPGTVEVAVDANNSTATPGTDFTFATQTVTFAAGQATQTVTVAVTGDTQPEADETVRLLIRNAAGSLVLGSPATHDLFITNDDGPAPTINFVSGTGSLNEGDTGTSTYTINVALSGSAPSANLTVPVTVVAAGSTADAADYTLGTTSLSFQAGQSRQNATVTITVNGDTNIEPNETVQLRLGQPSGGGAVLGSPQVHMFTITNDDQNAAGVPCTRLFFSEYAESVTGNTKVLELYNPSNQPINLTGYRIDLFANGATTPNSTLALTGTVAPRDVYVVANAGSVPAVLAQADNTGSQVTFFNGNDAVALFDGTDTVDVIGVIGQDPGATTGWTVPGGSTLNNTLIRRPTVSLGRTHWDAATAAEWLPQGGDVFTGIGQHTNSSCIVTSTNPARPVATGLQVYPNPATGHVLVQVTGLTSRESARIQLLDGLGRPVRQHTQTLGATDVVSLDLRGLAAGLYQVLVEAGNTRYISRVVVQP
ncbi:T9SS type A sorting domain-containing protein [Hymenobacter busanensis]|uniref:T9SS type A sorting domain-containing protein n=1 Tax=Hymenobacter busanensis TaxID=2607656 RepID=A0A7L4ZVL7_9BACT|nr:endonuclease [Hymenobacter busanensis]KAA9339171.1 T9SS type A sorting domain-containing protein [Hymenobacter busanensis]QHJ07067.1 T9SS type A sorting domain-containing protein [Hymenobacter busanensis]